MPHKIIELTVELLVHAVSCPGVWLCPEGPASLSVFTLGRGHRTARLPPVFPLAYNHLFYFRKRFHDHCTLHNLHCVLKEETIYCELVQWPAAGGGEGRVLAQYLGSLHELLFPPHTCADDAVDLLMRTTPLFPGILAPKVEVSSKIRVDEVWEPGRGGAGSAPSAEQLQLRRQKAVCHSLQYHKSRCHVPQRCCGPASQSPPLSSTQLEAVRVSEKESTGFADMQSSRPSKRPCACCRCAGSSRARESRSSDRDPHWEEDDLHTSCISEQLRRLPAPCTEVLPPPPLLPADCRDDSARQRHLALAAHGAHGAHGVRHEKSCSRGDESLPQRCRGRREEPSRSAGGCRGAGGAGNAGSAPHAGPCVCEICRRYHTLFHTRRADP